METGPSPTRVGATGLRPQSSHYWWRARFFGRAKRLLLRWRSLDRLKRPVRSSVIEVRLLYCLQGTSREAT